MPNDLNNIWSSDLNCLSKDTLRRYLEGDPEVQRPVEKHLVDCELCNAALEGFTTVPAFAAVPELNARIRKTATKGSGTNWTTWATMSTAGIAIILSTLVLLKPEQTLSEGQRPEGEPTIKETYEQPETYPELAHTIEEKVQEEPKVDQTILKQTISEQPSVTTNESEAEIVVRGPGPEKIVTRKTGPINSPDNGEERSRKPKIWSNVHVAFVHDLVVVDYSRILTTGVNTIEERYGSLHPQFENKQDRTIIKFEPRSYNIPYLEFMENAMSGFASGKPSKTLTDLEVLLEQHNGDVNGLFYSGLCYYHLDRPDLAVNFFDQAIGSSINTFYEEAKWYKALSLIRTGDKTTANKLFKVIAQEGGFYAERAQKRLDDFK